MALCTQLEVERKLQWDITAEPDSVITQHIEDAQATMESFIGRTIESDTRSQTLDGGRVNLFLKHWPVTGVSAVSEDSKSLTVDDDYKFYENGKLIRLSSGYQIAWQTGKPQAIAVTYVGGFLAGHSSEHDMELQNLGSICAEIVARAFYRGAKTATAGDSAALGDIQSVTIDDIGTVTYTTSGGESFSLSGGLLEFISLTDKQRNSLVKYQGPPFA